MSSDPAPAMSAAAIEALLRAEFPQIYADGDAFRIDAVGPMTARLRLSADDRHLRPGGTVSGPTLFALADLALYVAILAQCGPVTQAVTTTLTLNFLQRPPPGDLVANCTLLRLGRRRATGEVRVTGDRELVAHATGSYAIPANRSSAVL